MSQPKTRRGLRLPQVIEKTGLQKTQIFEAVRRGIFPKPFHVLPGGRAVAWDESEVDAHLDRQMAERESVAPDPAPVLCAEPGRSHPCQDTCVGPAREGEKPHRAEARHSAVT